MLAARDSAYIVTFEASALSVVRAQGCLTQLIGLKIRLDKIK